MAKRMKEKKEARLQSKDTRPRATASFVRMSPSKVARVLDGIRGKKYAEAFNFGPDEEMHYIIDEYLFKTLVDILKEQHGRT